MNYPALTLLLACFFCSGPLHAQQPPAQNELRELFLEGQQQAARERIDRAEAILAQLQEANYSLAPYLELSILLHRAADMQPQEVRNFMQRYPGTWLAEKLRLNYLLHLRGDRNYEQYIAFWAEGTGEESQRCFYLESLHRTGQLQQAWQGAKAMWLHGESRSDSCDYIFARWRRSDDFSEEYSWQRYILARRAGERSLSDYLTRLINDNAIELRIEAYQAIRREPELLLEVDAFISGGPGYAAVIAQGLRNLAESDMDSVLRLWPAYRDSGVLDNDNLHYFLDDFVERMVERRDPQQAYDFARQNRSLLPPESFEVGVIDRLRADDWSGVLDWIDLMGRQQQQENQWLYWRARATNRIGLPASDTYQQLLASRSYYSFLASELEEQPFNLNRSQPLPPQEVLAELTEAWQRAAELMAVDYVNNGRLTWEHAVDGLPEALGQQAARWALANNLPYFAIRATILMESWDTLELRFPLVWPELFEQAARDNNLPLSWLYGLSRQESAFAPEIVSSAGARGLMQIMPATARETARRMGVGYNAERLFEPDYNISLGANHLAEVYSELGNPVYATAAYNAGLSRVRGWLRNGGADLPLDVWIETIPFSETRNYVKNVMAFAVIYAQFLGLESPIEQLDDAFFLPGGDDS